MGIPISLWPMLFVAAFFGVYLRNGNVFPFLHKPELPIHLTNHPLRHYSDFVSVNLSHQLLDLVKEVQTYNTNSNDLVNLTRTYEHIGEAEPRLDNGMCRNSLHVPSKDGKMCHLPNRFDVAYHHMKYGGIEGMKEGYDTLASRIFTFGNYLFDLEKYPAMKEIFNEPKFIAAAKEVCPENRQFLDPYQYHLIIQVPGQALPVHIDAPFFTDASRFHYPIWLLAVMTASGLYKQTFIDQVQVVINLHEWTDPSVGGDFIYVPNNDVGPIFLPARPRSATVVDGSKVMHATKLYRPEAELPMLSRNKKNVLEYNKVDDTWELRSDGHLLQRYATDDLRITTVYRARCFESQAARDSYDAFLKNSSEENGIRPVAEIVAELKAELVRRKQVPASSLDKLSLDELAVTFVEEFIRYPVPQTWLPYNYCVLPKLYPILIPILSPLCTL
uniref:Fe2OG dioxygenase domain-containing protein n=1 Tax=Panagrellus redivivus TaxID=6233 RepID=A0A7E4ZQJ1_PANRE